MREIDTRIEIDATPDAVWAIVRDLGDYERWNPFIVRASGDPVPGTHLALSLRLGARATTLHPEVMPPASARELRWRLQLRAPGLLDVEHVLSVEPLGAARSLFRQRERFTGALVPLAAKQFDHRAAAFGAMNRALKDRAEGARVVAGRAA